MRGGTLARRIAGRSQVLVVLDEEREAVVHVDRLLVHVLRIERPGVEGELRVAEQRRGQACEDRRFEDLVHAVNDAVRAVTHVFQLGGRKVEAFAVHADDRTHVQFRRQDQVTRTVDVRPQEMIDGIFGNQAEEILLGLRAVLAEIVFQVLLQHVVLGQEAVVRIAQAAVENHAALVVVGPLAGDLGNLGRAQGFFPVVEVEQRVARRPGVVLRNGGVVLVEADAVEKPLAERVIGRRRIVRQLFIYGTRRLHHLVHYIEIAVVGRNAALRDGGVARIETVVRALPVHVGKKQAVVALRIGNAPFGEHPRREDGHVLLTREDLHLPPVERIGIFLDGGTPVGLVLVARTVAGVRSVVGRDHREREKILGSVGELDHVAAHEQRKLLDGDLIDVRRSVFFLEIAAECGIVRSKHRHESSAVHEPAVTAAVERLDKAGEIASAFENPASGTERKFSPVLLVHRFAGDEKKHCRRKHQRP